MKTIYLVRHAKSSWKHANLPDYERPLNQRGERDAPFMGELLKKNNIVPDLIVSSSAVRANSTSEILAEKMNYDKGKIQFTKGIYDAATNTLLDIIRAFDSSLNSVMLVGHNPGITMLAGLLAAEYIENMPTCSIAAIQVEVDNWELIDSVEGKLLWLEFPGKYFK